ncbi:family 78 glycoside hydrolase catalytic domain [Arcicella aquatica]|uniref:alpha-L-rhamnosidase n=1 Tax=Arcicella aquatica TaxID=217141 RepID=A0ABU5QLJ3_9BACT|nr:family 78 glycoside hydrolase catalytic domain [Arcicella aquatica]MEA5257918.1 family 78 glycoside hydrolase catalytic domain [Arcicella aquatica]
MKRKLLFFAFFLMANLSMAQLKLQQLKTENRVNPIGIDAEKPRFSWVLSTDKKNVLQTAYEIQVKKGKETIWSSGKVASSSSIFNSYGGSQLPSNTRFTWQVRAWDNQGQTSEWVTASFQTALNKTDWKAKWINSGFANDTVNGVVPMFRKSFETKKKITNATAFVTARGLYEIQFNGKRMGDAYLAPGWTSYNKHLQYQAYDVTNLLNVGKNAIGATLGSGWYRTRLAWVHQQNIYGKETVLLFQLELTYADGSKETVISDNSWKVAESDITYAEIYNGETIDARKRIANWTSVGFNDSNWKNAVEKTFPIDYINASVNEPIKKHESFKPVKVFKATNGETILDFGQNLVGWVTLTAQGKAGDKITLSHFEMMDKFGNPYFTNLRSAKAQATYILSGNGKDFFEPHFTFFGFRYVRVEGIEGKINPEDFTAYALYSDMEQTGSFETSNTLVNQLQKNIQWGQKGNFLDVPTDCPQRDERLGWTGDAEVFSRTASYNFNANQFFAKWLKDVTADQYPNGAVPHVIPDVLKATGFGQPMQAAGWGDAGIIIPYNVFVAFGDKQVLEDQYATMKKSVEYIRNEAKNDLWNTGFQFADWLSYRVDDSKGMIGMKSAITDNYLVAQCFYAYSVQLMINTAKVLGKNDDVKDYESLLAKVKKQFQHEYMTTSGRLISETQTAYILALQFDMLPEALRPQAVERLVSNIKSYDYHLTTGFLGTPFLNPVLSRFGRNDVAYKLLLQDTYPSWLYPIKTHGATTIWERWDSMKSDSTFQDPGMTSFNHYAYGAVGDWMYRNIAGIDTKEFDGAGYKAITIKPQLGGELTYAKGSLKTNHGLVSSAWKIENGKLLWDVEIPANSTATLTFPTKKLTSITEGGTSIKATPSGTLDVGSGKYAFVMDI